MRVAERAGRYGGGMQALFIADRSALADADGLMKLFGANAAEQAAARARVSRAEGNLLGFCHWRQIERVIATLASDEVAGTVH